jgi:hypothetical protein
MKAAQLFLFALALAIPARTVHADEFGAPSPAKAEVAKKKAKKKKKPDPNEAVLQTGPQEVSIPMARGQLEAEVAADVAQRERANAPRTKVELAATTWKPNRVTTGSRIANATDFQTKGMPALNASVVTPIAGRQVHLEVGFGFLALQRTGTITASGLSVPDSQNGYAMSLRLGVAYAPVLLLEDKLAPYVSATALPTMFVTRPSPFDDGVNDTGVPYELGAGAVMKVWKSVSVDLGVSETFGSVQDSDYKGFGVRGGVRVAI